jgi:hypothetical protein
MRAVVSGTTGSLSTRILHDDRKPFQRWIASQLRYAEQESIFLATTSWRSLRLQDKLRRLIVVTPWLVPLYCLFVRRGLLDGRAGLYYAMQRGIAEWMLSLRLIRSHRRR